MATPAAVLPIEVSVDSSAALRQVTDSLNRLQRGLKPLKLNVDLRPLGQISKSVLELDKSLSAATARTIAFGASVGTFYAVQKAITSTVTSAIEVEKKFKDIQVLLQASNQSFSSFQKGIFDVGRNTAASFNDVAGAALEFSRQGLKANDVLKATSAALILARTSGEDVGQAVKQLTAIVNTFNKEALNYNQIINKLANVDASFAVSQKDLADAISRAGSAATSAGVSFDKFIALTTSLQQTTQRGGGVIGNVLKSIFTRIERTGTLDVLEEFNVQVKDLQGNTLSADRVLQNLANTYKNLSESERSLIAERVGGVYQINQLKALLGDLAKANSIYKQSLDTSRGSQDQAIVRNEELNKTLDAQLKRTRLSLTQVGAVIGTTTFEPALKKVSGVLNQFLGFGQGLGDKNDQGGKTIGQKFAEGILTGLGSTLSGPGLLAIGAVLFNVFKKLGGDVKGAFLNFRSLNSEGQAQAELQKIISQELGNGNNYYTQRLANAKNEVEYNERLLELIRARNAEEARLGSIGAVAAERAAQLGVRANPSGRSYNNVPRAAGGILPSVMAEAQDVNRGVGGASSNARVKVIPNFNFGGGKRGTVVANTDEYIVPNYAGSDGSAIFNKTMVSKFGLPSNARRINYAGGLIPDYANRNITNDLTAHLFRNAVTPEGSGLAKITSKQTAGRALLSYLSISHPELNINDKLDRGFQLKDLIKELPPRVIGELSEKGLVRNVNIADIDAYRTLRNGSRGIIPNYFPLFNKKNLNLLNEGGFRRVYHYGEDKILSKPKSPEELLERLKKDSGGTLEERLRRPLQLSDVDLDILRETKARPGFQKILGELGLGPKVHKINKDGSFIADKIKTPTLLESLRNGLISQDEAAEQLALAKRSLQKIGIDSTDLSPHSGGGLKNIAYNVNTGQRHILDFAEGFLPSGAKARGYMPNYALKLQKNRTLGGRRILNDTDTRSSLSFHNTPQQIDIGFIASNQKGDAFKLMQRLGEFAKKRKKPIYSSELSPQTNYSREQLQDLDNYDALTKIFPQIKYRDTDLLKNTSGYLYHSNDGDKTRQSISFKSINDLKEQVTKIKNFNPYSVNINDLKTRFAGGLIPNFARITGFVGNTNPLARATDRFSTAIKNTNINSVAKERYGSFIATELDTAKKYGSSGDGSIKKISLNLDDSKILDLTSLGQHAKGEEINSLLNQYGIKSQIPDGYSRYTYNLVSEPPAGLKDEFKKFQAIKFNDATADKETFFIPENHSDKIKAVKSPLKTRKAKLRYYDKQYKNLTGQGLLNPDGSVNQEIAASGADLILDKIQPSYKDLIGKKDRSLYASGGLIPSFANPLTDAVKREHSAGIPLSQIRVEKNNQLINQNNPLGLGITNTRDEPGGISQGIARARKEGVNPLTYGARGANGIVPNFAYQVNDVSVDYVNKLTEQLNSSSRSETTGAKESALALAQRVGIDTSKYRSKDGARDIFKDILNKIKNAPEQPNKFKRRAPTPSTTLSPAFDPTSLASKGAANQEALNVAQVRAEHADFDKGRFTLLNNPNPNFILGAGSLPVTQIQRKSYPKASVPFGPALNTPLDTSLPQFNAHEIQYNNIQAQEEAGNFLESERGKGLFRSFGGKRRINNFIGVLEKRGISPDLIHQVKNEGVNINQNRNSRLQGAGLNASFALPLLAGAATNIFDNHPDSLNSRKFRGVTEGVSSGLSIAALGGFTPPALVAGGGVAIISSIRAITTNLKKSFEDLAKSVEDTRGKFEENKNAAIGLVNAQEQLKDIIERGGSRSEINAASGNANEALRSINDEKLRRQLLGSSTSEQKFDIIREYQDKASQKVAQESVGALAVNATQTRRNFLGLDPDKVILKDKEKDSFISLFSQGLKLDRDKSGFLTKQGQNQLNQFGGSLKNGNVQEIGRQFGLDADAIEALTKVSILNREEIAKAVVARKQEEEVIKRETDGIKQYAITLKNISRTLEKLGSILNFRGELNNISNQGVRSRAISGAKESLGVLDEFLSPESKLRYNTGISKADIKNEFITNSESAINERLKTLASAPEDLSKIFNKGVEDTPNEGERSVVGRGEKFGGSVREQLVNIYDKVSKGNLEPTQVFSEINKGIESLIADVEKQGQGNKDIVDALKGQIVPLARDIVRFNRESNEKLKQVEQSARIQSQAIQLQKKSNFLGGNFEQIAGLDLGKITAGLGIGKQLRDPLNNPFLNRIYKSRGSSFSDFFNGKPIDAEAETSRRANVFGKKASGSLQAFQLGLFDNNDNLRNKTYDEVAAATQAQLEKTIQGLQRQAKRSGDVDLFNSLESSKAGIPESARLKARREVPLSDKDLQEKEGQLDKIKQLIKSGGNILPEDKLSQLRGAESKLRNELGPDEATRELQRTIFDLNDTLKDGVKGDFEHLIESAEKAADALGKVDEATGKYISQARTNEDINKVSSLYNNSTKSINERLTNVSPKEDSLRQAKDNISREVSLSEDFQSLKPTTKQNYKSGFKGIDISAEQLEKLDEALRIKELDGNNPKSPAIFAGSLKSIFGNKINDPNYREQVFRGILRSDARYRNSQRPIDEQSVSNLSRNFGSLSKVDDSLRQFDSLKDKLNETTQALEPFKKQLDDIIKLASENSSDPEIQKRLKETKSGIDAVNNAKYNGYLPNYANGLSKEFDAIKSGIGGAQNGDIPYVRNIKGLGRAVVNTGEMIVPFGNKEAVFNRDMLKSVGFMPNYAGGSQIFDDKFQAASRAFDALFSGNNGYNDLNIQDKVNRRNSPFKSVSLQSSGGLRAASLINDDRNLRSRNEDEEFARAQRTYTKDSNREKGSINGTKSNDNSNSNQLLIKEIENLIKTLTSDKKDKTADAKNAGVEVHQDIKVAVNGEIKTNNEMVKNVVAEQLENFKNNVIAGINERVANLETANRKSNPSYTPLPVRTS